VFQHLESDHDVEQHLELMKAVFGVDSRVDIMARKWIDHHPAMSLSDFFVIKHRNKIVSGLNLIPSIWSIGGVQLKVAELACVATLPEYRHQGLQRRLMNKYHDRLSKQGYDLSAIEGIPYYYRQFGYEYAIPLDEQIRIKLDQIPDSPIKHKIRPFKTGDIPKAMQLLGQSQRKFYIHTIRAKDIWKMQQETEMVAEYKFEAYVVEEKGVEIAYLRLNENQPEKTLMLREVTDVDQATAQSILGFLKDIGKKRGLETLVATISGFEPFTEHMVAIGGVKQPPYAWQMRVTDYAKLFQKIKPLLDKRLASSTYRHITEKISFNFYRYTVQLTIQDGAITGAQRLETNEDRTIRANPMVFTQLLLGYRSREELQAIYPDFIVRPSRRNLIDVLFPKMPSYIHTEY
jgi:predicted acetyltransferase